jgi:hypothetical protein
MYGVVKETLSLRAKTLLRQNDRLAIVESQRMPKELIKLIKTTIVTQAIGRTEDFQADVLIRRWQLIKCGETEDADDFVPKTEQL